MMMGIKNTCLSEELIRTYMFVLKYVLVEMSNCIACLDSLKELLEQLLGQPNATIVCVAETYFKRTWWKRSEASLDTNNRKFRDSFFPFRFQLKILCLKVNSSSHNRRTFLDLCRSVTTRPQFFTYSFLVPSEDISKSSFAKETWKSS